MGKDVAMALGYSNTRDALSRHVDVEDKGVVNHDTPSGIQKMTIINESGLYSLILLQYIYGLISLTASKELSILLLKLLKCMEQSVYRLIHLGLRVRCRD